MQALKHSLLFDSRWFGDHGIGRFAREVYSRLAGYGTPSFAGNPWDAADFLRTSWHLRKQRPAFYFTPGYNAPLGRPCPFALTVHDLNHIATPGQSTALKRFYYEAILRPAIQRADVVLTVSEYSRAAIVSWSGVDARNVVNVANGVSPAFRREGPVHQVVGKPYLLGIASPKQHKNQEGLLRGYAASSSRKAIDLLMLGARNEPAERTLTALGVSESVRFLGRLSDADLAAVYRGATGFLFVSHYEGFGLPIVEAMACGTPVITSSVAAMPEVAGGAALLVDPLSVEDIGAAIDRLCDSAELRTDLRDRGLRRAAQFSWDETGRRVCAALNSAIDSKGRREARTEHRDRRSM
jgi:glycosyltransferase involved in cell wall biosynthesis